MTEIEDHTFYGCVSLGDGDTVDLSNTNLQYIGEKAFADCISIRHIALPASLTSLGNYAFESCRVSLVVFFYDNHCTLNLDEFYFPTKAILVENRAGLGDEETSVQKYADAFHLEYTTLTPPTTTTTTVMTTTPPATTIVTTDTTAQTTASATKGSETMTMPPYITVTETAPATTTQTVTGETTASSETGTATTSKAEESASSSSSTEQTESTASETTATSVTTTVSTAASPARHTLGDVNDDGSIDSTDIFEIMYAAARIGAGKDILHDGTLSEETQRRMDINGDGRIEADDVYAAMLYCAMRSVGMNPTPFESFDWANHTVYTG